MRSDQAQLVELSQAKHDDAFALAALELQLNREHGRPGEPGFLDRYADAWLAQRDRRPAWVATAFDGRPLGGLVLHVVDALPTPGRTACSWAFVTTWYVSAPARRAGIGERLLRTATGWCAARQLERVQLRAGPDSRLPRRLGFVPAGRTVLELTLR